MTNTNTTATLAADLDTTPRTLRKFLRSADMGVGKGSRYALPSSKREVARLRKQFTAWQAEVEAKRSAKVEEAPVEAAEVEVEAIDEAPAADDFDSLECPLDA